MSRARDRRDRLWQKLERDIQLRASDKDRSFRLSGKWKRLVRNQSGYMVFIVDGRWVRDNLCVYFGHGGHGLVHEFIPVDEIWISSRHYHELDSEISRCVCRVKKKGQKVTRNYFESTVLHEVTECEQMKRGKKYWEAHQIALKAEKDAGLLKDPFDDTG